MADHLGEPKTQPKLTTIISIVDAKNGSNSNGLGTVGEEEKCRSDASHSHLDKARGLGWFVTALFLVSDMAGGGLVALPTAMVQSGFWTGIFLSLLMTLMFMYTAVLLGKNWVILQQRWPEDYLTKHCRQPYPEMGRRALGQRMRNYVAVCIDTNQFGTTVVYILLSAKNIHDSMKAFFDSNVSFCLLLVVLAFLLLPLTFLNSPQDFWPAAVLAVLTTSCAVVLICVGALTDSVAGCASHHGMPEFRPTNYFLAMGTLLFAYGGHPAFPTVQHDMRRPDQFHKSSLAAFTILFSMYTPVCILGFIVYGNSLRESVINSLQHIWIQQTVNVMITLHLIVTILIVNNPLNQKAEEIFHVPHKFGMRRVVVRTCMMAIVLFVAETVPQFGPLLNLIGGSVLMACSLVFPCLFYLFLNAGQLKANERALLKMGKEENADEEDELANWTDVLRTTDRFTLSACLFIIVFGMVGGAAATFSAIRELSFVHFVPPCYFSALAGSMEPNAGGHVNCCGPFQNISVYAGPETCSPANTNFYN